MSSLSWLLPSKFRMAKFLILPRSWWGWKSKLQKFVTLKSKYILYQENNVLIISCFQSLRPCLLSPTGYCLKLSMKFGVLTSLNWKTFKPCKKCLNWCANPIHCKRNKIFIFEITIFLKMHWALNQLLTCLIINRITTMASKASCPPCLTKIHISPSASAIIRIFKLDPALKDIFQIPMLFRK